MTPSVPTGSRSGAAPRRQIAGLTAAAVAACLLAGAAWGVAIFSWALPMPVELRYGTTALVLAALAAGGQTGRIAAAALALGMSASGGLILARGGLLVSEWGLVPLAALITGLVLSASVLFPRRGE